jgi:hypothetical protein
MPGAVNKLLESVYINLRVNEVGKKCRACAVFVKGASDSLEKGYD